MKSSAAVDETHLGAREKECDKEEKRSGFGGDEAVMTYLGHEPVCAGVLLILENDVCVVVGSQFFKALGVSGDLAFVSAARPEGLLRHVGDELLVRERCQLFRVSSPAVAPAGSASHRGGHQGQADDTEQY